MNCIQAQAMLAAYRELRDSKADTTELEVHLEHCASCRQVLANYNLIGEQIRSLPIRRTTDIQMPHLITCSART